MKMFSGELNQTSFMISQYWLKKYLGAVKQGAIIYHIKYMLLICHLKVNNLKKVIFRNMVPRQYTFV